ncbi:MAG: bifunctional methylenetetrahydrofolate dehydrogenase/methenyltetrahydrofolate cyclohydrolase FolD [Myxococcaceae bacterium]
MTAKILDGQWLARQILDRLKEEIRLAPRVPGLCAIQVGQDPASQIYVRNKIKCAAEIGIHSVHHALSEQTSEQELLELINKMNQDPQIDGILVQLPLPAHISTEKVIRTISPLKDVDGFHPENIGLLSIGKPRFIPCTPKGCMRLIEISGLNLAGVNAVVVGRSNIVGKPMAQLLMNSEATVTVCHKQTRDLKSFTRQADLLVVAAGSPHLIKADFVKPGAVILDVGINRLPTGKLIGDVDTEGVIEVAQAITPVPKGVGPMTTAMLMENTWLAMSCENRLNTQHCRLRP